VKNVVSTKRESDDGELYIRELYTDEITPIEPINLNRIKLNTCISVRNALIPVTIEKNVIMALTDSGANRSFVNSKLTTQARLCKNVIVELADGSTRVCNQEAVLHCGIGGKTVTLAFLILDGLNCDCIIGLDIQAALDITIHARQNCVKIAGEKINFLPKKIAHKLAKAMTKSCANRFRDLMENPEILEARRLDLQRRIDARKSTSENEDTPRNKCRFDLTLAENELAAARKFVDSQTSCFTSKEKPLGHITGTFHRVQPTGKPFKMKIKPISPTMLKEQKKQIENMLKHGVIKPSNSDWAMTPCFAPKPDGTWRFCVNFKPINNRCLGDCYPLPRAPDLLEIFQGCNYFSKLDAAMGYWQLPIHPDDTKYCSFICQEGQFEFVRMPFGLMNAPSTFQRLNDRVLAPYLRKTCVVYLDDVIVYSRTFDEHVQHLTEVMTVMAESGQLLRPEKCDFFMKNCEYLGHTVGGGGIKMSDDKYTKILTFPIPQNRKQLKRFLGIVSYYRKFVKNLALLAKPLRELEHNETYEWTEECKTAFDLILKKFNENAVLAHPDYTKEFVIECDASDAGVGAILMQQHKMPDGSSALRPVFFASRALTKGEKKWPPREQEGLAIVWALQQFRHHILGNHFTVYSDHQSLEWLMNAKVGKLARWALILAEYEPFIIKYKSGKQNKAADALSRIYEETELLPEIATCAVANTEEILERESTPDEPMRLTETVERWISDQKALTPTRAHLYQQQREDIHCLQRLGNLNKYRYHVVVDGLLGVSVDGTRFKPILPKSMINDIVKAFHTSAYTTHLGTKRTMQKIASVFIIPKLRKKCKDVIKTCELCMARKTPLQKVGWLASKPATKMWSQVAMDFAGPYPESSNGRKYVLVMIDQFSKYVEIVATERNDAATVLSAFNERIICRHGCPERLLTDNHRQFKNLALDAVCHAFGCFKSYCSKYYPQGDGHVERFMRNMNDTLSILCDGSMADWDHYIPGVQFAYNTTVHSVTGITPFFLNHMREPRFPHMEDYSAALEGKRKTQAPTQYARKLRNIITNVRTKAKNAIARAWLVSAKAYNKNRTAVRIKLGDHVLIRMTPALRNEADVHGKLPLRWSKPMLVTETRSSGKAFEVCDPDTKQKHVINATRMLPIPPDSWRVDKQHLGAVMRDLSAFYQSREVREPEYAQGMLSSRDRSMTSRTQQDQIVESTRDEHKRDEQQNNDVQTRPSLPDAVTYDQNRVVDVGPQRVDRTTTGTDAHRSPMHIAEDPPEAQDNIGIQPLTLEEMANVDGRAVERDQNPEVVQGEQLPSTIADPQPTQIQQEYEEMDRDRQALIQKRYLGNRKRPHHRRRCKSTSPEWHVPWYSLDGGEPRTSSTAPHASTTTAAAKKKLYKTSEGEGSRRRSRFNGFSQRLM
jgi:hypothetical protein